MRKLTSVMLAVLAGLCFWLAAIRQPSLLATRRHHDLDPVEPLENAPPLVAFTTVVLGGFRGLMTDILWLRVSYLQDAGKYFELVQLSDWITKLEPHSTEIWAFHAWNMAYNISLMMAEPEDRWRWVQNGIELLRDKGIVYNPGDPRLYFELGWLFQHKIGGTSDEAHRFYKRQWAEAMQELFDGGRPDIEALSADTSTGRRARETFKLDPDIVRTVDLEYGPLDWRLPETHAVYWACRGRRRAGTTPNLFCDRMIFQSMSRLFWQGRLVTADNGRIRMTLPAPDLAPRVMAAYEQAMQRHPGTPSIRDGYVNFLRHACVMLYTLEATSTAEQVLAALKDLSPDVPDQVDLDAFVRSEIAHTLADQSNDRILAGIETYLFQHLLWSAIREPRAARAAERMAELYWNDYASKRTEQTSTRPTAPSLDRLRKHARQRAYRELPPALRNRLPRPPFRTPSS